MDVDAASILLINESIGTTKLFVREIHLYDLRVEHNMGLEKLICCHLQFRLISVYISDSKHYFISNFNRKRAPNPRDLFASAYGSNYK